MGRLGGESLARRDTRRHPIQARLSQAAGVTTLWLSPVFKQRGHLDTFHGYGVQDFMDVDPHLGSRRDLVDLSPQAHRQEMPSS